MQPTPRSALDRLHAALLSLASAFGLDDRPDHGDRSPAVAELRAATLAEHRAALDAAPRRSCMMSRQAFGSLRLLASGRYQVRYRHDGGRHNAPVTFTTKNAARDFPYGPNAR